MLKPRLATITHTLKNHLDLHNKRLSLAIGGAILAGTAAITGVAVSAVASSTEQSSVHEVQQKAGSLTYGVDVSRYESDYDWSASPAKFGIIKATEGTSFRDASFARHWREMDKKGIVRGAYHYGHPGNDPIAEAEYFLSMANSQPAKAGDLLVLDLETTDGKSVAEVNAWAKKWLSHVKAKTGVTPMLYSGWNFANTYGKGLAEYPLWVAHYSKAKGQLAPPADWKSWAIHQYTDSPVDQNVSVLTPDQLRDLGRPAV
ncbi:glycoside hydrolase family 25 protein [Nonomuraea basaltis]|uniref:glycoside hydrolase family 25 protein n=1 Tax=Nonomuraea basaltis TaxID=2495887 RepID=UPI001486E204|nr:GH25 family lysozyme [Nonomuraea basaltis]